MKRAVLVLIAALLAVGPPAAAQERTVVEASSRASVLFSQIDVQPAFDPAFADSRASSSTIGTSSLQSVAWPGFLVDAFFYLYGFQSVERVALGIAEARWPQGPTEVDATQSDLLFLNAGDPESIPGRGGESVARAGEGSADGRVRWARITIPAVGVIAAARSETSVETGEDAISHARQEALGVDLGPIEIDAIRGTASVSSDGDAEATLEIVGARIAGEEVVIDDEGARAVSAPAQEAVDGALAGSGMSIRVLPQTEEGSPGSATASSGGVLVLLQGEFPDPATGDTTSVTLGFILGAADATARATTVGSDLPDVVEIPRHIPCFCEVELPFVPAPAPPSQAQPQIIRRIVVTTAAAGIPIGARGAYAAVMLIGLGLIFIRPFVRAASRA